ncbi:alcohol oxidase [Aspergillus piperis CBS 112811]|uniref:Alcohol oxidase n=1 Tax=Aspergillus piperis CBS 112811 TaxID=1448313 RepID=A0A8G1R6T8_9EURO|nr:alcohol oxidase [Aspergillus piperis CBS 112811]RAH59324.1 alcohol oxidase [Aspergillus piperis CBS 112811]
MDPTPVTDFIHDTFDFSIVGGGTAGLVLAARLSEDPNVRVGVIEAGVSRLGDPKVDTPTGMAMTLKDPEYDWCFQTSPQSGVNNRTYATHRGKMLGGSSGLHSMMSGRPTQEEINDWGKATGVKGWEWSDLLPYFKKHEKLEVDQPNITSRDTDTCPLDPGLHGTEGPIHHSFGTWHVPFEKDLIPALDAVSGLSRPENPYAGNHLGFYRTLFTIDRTDRPVRSYAASGYLAPNSNRSNLRVLTDALVCKITLGTNEHNERQATGVEFLHHGMSYTVQPRKEVILSAGAVQSPQLLELSGIGDPNVLGRIGIPCIVPNMDVGNNLQEQALCSVVYELAPGYTSVDSLLRDHAIFEEYQKFYEEKHTGALSGSLSITGYTPYATQVEQQDLEKSVACFLDPKNASTKQDTVLQNKQRKIIAARIQDPTCPCIQYMCAPENFNTALAVDNLGAVMSGPPSGFNDCYSITMSQMHPVSRGRVHVVSDDPMQAPDISPGLLAHPADVDVLAAGVGFADRVFRSELVRGKVARRVRPDPGVDVGVREQVKEFVRESAVPFQHFLGTCALGMVVDERLRVKRIKGLRVVDASIVPMMVSPSLAAVVYAVAERAADLVKEDYGLK